MDGPANPPPFYPLIEDELYKAQAADLGIIQKELDATLHDLTWTIARIPMSFPCLPQTNTRRAIHVGKTRLRVWFTFDGQQVVLRFIEKWGPNEI